MQTKVIVLYEHNPADTQRLEMAVTTGVRPTPGTWVPAYRDTLPVNGQPRRVVWAWFPEQGRRVTVWIKDRDGARPVEPRVV